MAAPLARFGKYELVSRLARGGMAETWRAQLKAAAGVTKSVVIKKVLPHFAEDPQFIEAFINEAKISASFSHGNIAQVFDFGRVDGDYFIAMELVDGRSLAQVLARAADRGFTRVPAPIACYLASELLKGLHYAHSRVGADGAPLRVVHRDVSPDNLLISYEGQVKVVDFGVAKAVLHGRKDTEPGMLKGKFEYFSPEQALAGDLDARSDVFAVGVVLYRMLCGTQPFAGPAPLVLRNIVDGVYPPPVGLPEPLTVILVRALQRAREDRYATALQMQQALGAWLYGHDPAFSEETVKDWMSWLFRSELESEGRDASVSGHFTQQLSRWQTPPAQRIRLLATQGAAPKPAVAPVVWVACAALVAGGVLGLAVMDSNPPAAVPPVPMPIAVPVPVPGKKPTVVADVIAFPGTATVSAARHRLHFERVSLPEVRPPRERLVAVFEDPAPGLDPLFALERSSRADADGHVAVVLRTGTLGLLPFSGLKLFDFQPFGVAQPATLRSVAVGAEARHFAHTEAQLDGRAGAWVTVTGVNARARLTLTPVDPAAWAGRPRRPSVVVAWQRAAGAGPDDGAEWRGGVTRAVLREGAPLVVDAATAFAFAFADSFATADADSVKVVVEAAPDAPPTRFVPAAVAASADQIDDVVAVNHPRLLPCFTVLVWDGDKTAVDLTFQVLRGKPVQLTLDPPKQRKAALQKCLQAELELWRFPRVEGASKTIALHYSAKAQNFDPLPEGSAPPENREERSALTIARELMREKDYARARTTLQGCLHANPNNADCHMLLGTCYARLGDREQAALHYQAFVRIAPASAPEVKFAKKVLADYGRPAE